MPMDDQSLQAIQHWMTTVMTTRGNLEEKLQTAANAFQLHLDDVVASKRGLSAGRRLQIYTSGYVLRLLDCLKGEFPGLLAFMGEALFEVFAKAYIVNSPPQSWSLLYLGQGFPRFLRDTRPKHGPGDPQNEDLLDLPNEIAAFERIRTEVQHAKGTEDLPASMSHDSTEPLEYLYYDIKVQVAPCLRLLRQEFYLPDFLKGLQRGEMPPIPARKTTYLAVTRRDFSLRTLNLEPWQYAFLQACTDPASIRQAAAKAATESSADVKKILSSLLVWLPMAMDNGCLMRYSGV